VAFEKKIYNDLHRKYEEEVVPYLMKKFGYKNVMEVPKIVKIVVNRGIGQEVVMEKASGGGGKKSAFGSAAVEKNVKEIELITKQKPMVTRARKSIHGFKIRKGMPVGVMVTLRKGNMWDFLDRLINTALPRVRDFKGLNPRGFDGRGNYNFGLKEQLVWPEIPYELADKQRGMDITIVTTAKTDEEAYALLEALGVPFKKK
jgi:large subunit ribosomal protein L5